jgi:hypothetical protein
LWLKDYYLSVLTKQVHSSATVLVSKKNDDVPLDFDEQFSENNLRVAQGFQRGMAEKNEQMLRSKGSDELEAASVMRLLKDADCLDVLLAEANEVYASQDLIKAFELLKKIKDLDPFCLEAVPLLCTVMIELGKQADLYLMAHKLVESNPDLAVPW